MALGWLTVTRTSALVISHASCPDGFAAAWVARHCLLAAGREVEVYFAFHNAEPPWELMADRDIYMLDFAYRRPVMERVLKGAKSLVVLDHHKTAEADLKDFPGAVFDMTRSGAGMTWDHFNPGVPRPWLVDYVEDRDLWAWKLQDSKAVNAFISTLEMNFDAWDQAANEAAWAPIVAAGRAVISRTKNYVAETKKNALRFDFEGFNVPIVNACQVDISELVGELAEGEPFAMGWFQRADGKFSYSLRSKGEVDVSGLAKKHGGGGHAKAAGFQHDHPFHLDGMADAVQWKAWLAIVAGLIGLWAAFILFQSF